MVIQAPAQARTVTLTIDGVEVAVPEGTTNLGLIGQYVEVPRDIAFTIEYSARTAWEAVYTLLKRGPAPPPVYQGQYDLRALFGALKVFLGL